MATPAAVMLPTKLQSFNRAQFQDTCKRRFFYGLAFEPYGGTAGLYDLGPTMCAMKSNVLQYWRQHFVLQQAMCEVDTTCLTPEEIFIASGHVARFNDVMIRDTVTGECIRADKFLEQWCQKQLGEVNVSEKERQQLLHLLHNVAGYTTTQIKQVLTSRKILSPKGNMFSDPFPFNLMFSTHIGPEGDRVGYLRPELAQGIILNFKRLLDSGNAQRMPFAGACIGTAFRNEIAPRAALIRVREFTLAEIEHFVNPNDKTHEKFQKIANVVIWAWPRERQADNLEPIRLSIGQAVRTRTIDNETLGYFIARVALFLQSIGVRHYRFRQHQTNEMAHYAQDCWDAQLLTSYGWIECVGIADRSAYDLTQHSNASKKDLYTRQQYSTPRIEQQWQRKLNKGVIGKTFGKTAGDVIAFLNKCTQNECSQLHAALTQNSKSTIMLSADNSVQITRDMIQLEKKSVKVNGRNYTPSVIEPSFGIGRILYCLLQQSYWVRRDQTKNVSNDSNNIASNKNQKRAVFSLVPLIAPQKVAVLPLMVKPEIMSVVNRLREELVMRGISVRVDDSGVTIGKKYARVDQLGIPFAITCDLVNDDKVTLRERDSASQVRISTDEVATVICQLCHVSNPHTWEHVQSTYPAQQTNVTNEKA